MRKSDLHYPIPAADGFICPYCGKVKQFTDESKNCQGCGNEMQLKSKEHGIAISDKMFYAYSDFDGEGVVECHVIAIYDDHFILQDNQCKDIQYYFSYGQLEYDVFRSKEKAEESLEMVN